MTGRIERIQIFGLPIDVATTGAVVFEVDRGLQTGLKHRTLLAMNPAKIYTLERDPELKEFFEKADILIPDGIGLVWALRVLNGVRLSRLTGADLMEDLCALADRRGYRVFFFGATEEVNAGAVDILARRYPGMKVVGRRNGFIREDGMHVLVEQINVCRPDLVFVAMGSPRQEQWMMKYSSCLDAGLFQGLGGTLDTITGHVPRAPRITQKFGLEWLYRVLREPHRLPRYGVLPRFVFRVIFAKMKALLACRVSSHL